MSDRDHGKDAGSQEDLGLRRWEFNVLVVESILLGAGLFAGAWWLATRILGLPGPVGLALGSFVLGWTIFPALRCYGRSTGRPVRGLRFAVASLVGACVGGLLYWWLL